MLQPGYSSDTHAPIDAGSVTRMSDRGRVEEYFTDADSMSRHWGINRGEADMSALIYKIAYARTFYKGIGGKSFAHWKISWWAATESWNDRKVK